MQIRIFDELDFAQSVDLRKYVFRSELTVDKYKDYSYLLTIAECIGAFNNENQLMGQILNLPIVYNFYGKQLPCVGVNHVGVYPEYRELGVAKGLMKESIEIAYRKGQILSVLQPFSVSFYRKFGYDLLVSKNSYTISKELYPKINKKSEFRIKRLSQKDLTHENLMIIKSLYNGIYSSINGSQFRDDDWWTRIGYQYVDLNYALVYLHDSCVGYLSYRIIDTRMIIIDFIGKDKKTEDEIWGFIFSHRANVFEIIGMTTSARPIGYSFSDPRIKQSVLYDTMVRIIDVYKFLEIWFEKFPSNDTLIFSVHDSHAKWNIGTYKINSNVVNKISNDINESLLLLDIKDLATLFLGPLTSIQLEYQMSVNNEEMYSKLLKELVNKQPAHFLGEF